MKKVTDQGFNSIGKVFNASFHHTMLRIKNPDITIPFYETNFGMHCVGKCTYNNNCTSYFLEKFKNNTFKPKINSQESKEYLTNTESNLLEFIHYHGSESDPDFKINNGNVEPHRGFGHIAFNVIDVHKSTDILISNGVKFQKKPWEGTMKNIAFALDPDGYWIELVSRNVPSEFEEDYNLSQTMIRIKDPKKSIQFYTKYFGMNLIQIIEKETFTLYFLATLPEDSKIPNLESDDCRTFVKGLWGSTLELTHNHGTENNDNFSYHNGNTSPEGFGYISFLVNDLNSFMKQLSKDGIKSIEMTKLLNLDQVNYISDPDDYCVQIIQRGSNILN